MCIQVGTRGGAGLHVGAGVALGGVASVRPQPKPFTAAWELRREAGTEPEGVTEGLGLICGGGFSQGRVVRCPS